MNIEIKKQENRHFENAIILRKRTRGWFYRVIHLIYTVEPSPRVTVYCNLHSFASERGLILSFQINALYFDTLAVWNIALAVPLFNVRG